MSIKPPPQSDAEWARQVNQRIRALEAKKSVWIGDSLLHADETGRVLLTTPAKDALNVGDPITDDVDITALRGYVSPSAIAQAVSGGKTNSLSTATDLQVTDGALTGNAQYTADNANALAAQAMALLQAGSSGVAYSDTFDRPLALDLGPDYDMTHSAGPNNYGTVGDGTSGHTTGLAGSNPEAWFFRYLHDMNTTQQRISATLVSAPVAGHDPGVNGRLALAARVDASLPLGTIDGRIEAHVEYNRCRIGYFPGSAGAFVDLSGWQPTVTSAGDSFDFWVGLDSAGHDRYKFALLRNNLTVCVADDIPENTSTLLANRQGGFGVTVPIIQVFFFYNLVSAAPNLQSVNFADRIAV